MKTLNIIHRYTGIKSVLPEGDQEICLHNLSGKIIARVVMGKSDAIGTVYKFGKFDRRNKIGRISTQVIQKDDEEKV